MKTTSIQGECSPTVTDPKDLASQGLGESIWICKLAYANCFSSHYETYVYLQTGEIMHSFWLGEIISMFTAALVRAQL